MWLANPHSILRGGFSLSRAKAVFIPPAELVVVARSSYPKQNPAEDNDHSSSSAGSTALRLVEAMGVEPMSEKSSVQVSPGAGDLQHSRRATPIVRLALW